ncbi:MAG: hypothetical protein ABS82_10005 [Rhodanobacter sp. SCN 67-45]|nr:MAG: hypothetical protein ABS82_10005 [Rhodanobacter sp. SCN 67-45]
MRILTTFLLACLMLFNVNTFARELPPITPVAHVDLPRFMGDWYVIATIPTRFEKNAYNAVEVYALRPDGNVATSFHFRNGSFDGERKEIHSTGFVKPGTGNAVWGVQVFWPLKAQYIVAWLKDDYSQVIVARDYDALLARVKALGYLMDKVRKVPQQARQ